MGEVDDQARPREGEQRRYVRVQGYEVEKKRQCSHIWSSAPNPRHPRTVFVFIVFPHLSRNDRLDSARGGVEEQLPPVRHAYSILVMFCTEMHTISRRAGFGGLVILGIWPVVLMRGNRYDT